MSKQKDKTKGFISDYLTEEKKAEPVAAGKEKKEKAAPKYEKGTFYLSSGLLSRLEAVWVRERAKDRRVTKSGLVEKFIDEGLKGLEERGTSDMAHYVYR